MKIIHLKTENVQRIKAVEVTPEGNLVVIGGNNGHGKTSLLDSIMFALGGKKQLSAKPVREGAKEGAIEINTGEFVIKRTIKPTGDSHLQITGVDGAVLGSPQKLLDKLTSQLTFDPLGFANMESKEQVGVIKGLIPFDFSGNETLRKSRYDERTGVNRELNQKKAENEANPFDPSYPIDEEQFDETELLNISKMEIAKAELVGHLERGKNKIIDNSSKIEALTAQIKALQTENESISAWVTANQPKLAEFGNLDERVEQIKLRTSQQHDRNARIRKNAEAKKIYTEMKALDAKVSLLTKQIEELDKEKMVAIEGAALPVAGLSFTDDTGVQFGRIPFAQLSGAERLKVSLAMGVALNPTLRILLIRDGSLLDAENIKVVAEMAAQHDMQVWIERVGKGEECSVIIEDGSVAENRTVKAGAELLGSNNDDGRHLV